MAAPFLTILLLFLLPLESHSPPGLKSDWIVIWSDGPVVYISWSPASYNWPTKVFRGRKLIYTAAPGVTEYNYTETHYGIATFTVLQTHPGTNQKYTASGSHSLGRLSWRPPPQAHDGFYVYIWGAGLNDPVRYDVGPRCEVPLIEFCLAPGTYQVAASTYVIGPPFQESDLTPMLSFTWHNAMLE